MTVIVHLKEAEAALGGQTILRGMTLEIAPGEVVGVVGPNGSGKTTLLRVMATLVPIVSGSGSVLGARLGTSEVHPVRRSIGLIGHLPTVIGELTLRENLEHAARLGGVESERIETALRIVGLDDAGERRGADSSFGMLRRTETARLLLTRPRLLLLDEAFSGLDGDAQKLLDALIERTLAEDGSAVVVSHDRGLFAERATRVMSLDRGRLEAA